MGTVVSLQERREQQAVQDHARALVLFECAAILARRRHPALMQLIEESFGREEIEQRIKATVSPQRADDAPMHQSTRRRA